MNHFRSASFFLIHGMLVALALLSSLLAGKEPLFIITDSNEHSAANHSSTRERREAKQIAVCISGQISRFLPESTVPHLLAANRQFRFVFFVNLQYHLTNHSYVFSTDANIAFQPTKFADMNHIDALRHVHELFTVENQSSVASVRFVPPRSQLEWERMSFNDRKIDRISQYADMEYVILNYYWHHDSCYQQIVQYERVHDLSFDYVLSSREDVIYLQSVDLAFLITHFRAPGSSSAPKRSTTAVSASRDCDFITKDCLQWGGIHMRWQLMTRNASQYVIGKRFEYYRRLYKEHRQIYNPEQFEMQQLEFYHQKVCEFPASVITNIVARHVINEEVCFLRPETIDNCVPPANDSFVRARMCHRVNQKLRVSLDSK